MASSKEITGKIKSIENTKKVTSALEMVSASKIRNGNIELGGAGGEKTGEFDVMTSTYICLVGG